MYDDNSFKMACFAGFSSNCRHFFCNIAEGFANNVWLARGIGCLVAGLTGAVFYHYVIQTSKS